MVLMIAIIILGVLLSIAVVGLIMCKYRYRKQAQVFTDEANIENMS